MSPVRLDFCPFPKRPHRVFALAAVLVLLASVLAVSPLVADGRPLTFTDLMKFRQIEDTALSRDGRFLAYSLVPDRGDGEAVVKAVAGTAEHRVERGTKPVLSPDGRWAAIAVLPTFAEREKAKDDKDEAEELENALALIDLRSGERRDVAAMESFAFSGDGRFLAMKRYAEKVDAEEANEETAEGEPTVEEGGAAAVTEAEQPATDEVSKSEEKLGTSLVLRHLKSGTEVEIPYVTEYAFDASGAHLAYATATPGGLENGAFLRVLGDPETTVTALAQAQHGHYAGLTWTPRHAEVTASRLAYLAATLDDDDEPGDAELWVWKNEPPRRLASAADAPQGFTLPADNELTWSRDGERLFFGFRPRELMDEEEEEGATTEEGATEEETAETNFDPFDTEAILAGREVDVWHWNDPKIIPHQKESWKDEKKRLFLAVAHLDSAHLDRRVVPLADREAREVEPADNPRAVLAFADTPYLEELTWVGSLADLYLVDLEDGSRHQVASRLWDRDSAALSPGGRFVAFYEAGHWHLFDGESGARRNLTAGLEVPFANEDHDYPQPAPGYETPLWLADESAVLIYDKYDVWAFPVDGAAPRNLTAGRERETTFRVVDLDPERDAVPAGGMLLHGYHQEKKHEGFFATSTREAGAARRLLETGEHRFRAVAKAEKAPLLVFTRENYREFPDLWTTRLELEGEVDGGEVGLGEPRRQSDANPQISDFAWGEAELVEFSSLDGEPLQGVLIKPGNWDPDKRYPVLVYYYRFFSQRLHEFNEPVVNHRPSFPFYASNGYAVFLPDVRFEIGRPGLSATKSLVPGVQKLIDMGIADPEAIGLHGHSWSGYQTAFVITQTDIFAAAVAGAPVSNMTSAYGGIRWGSGLSRQFQYERSQSRIGGSLWEYPERYIENSPLFFADEIETPLLIQFGDEDGAVPWTQGIELYMAMRRLDKECVMLQYRREPHHLKEYANKLDYSIKMKQFFDHHLLGAPAPEWWTEGVAYRGE